jgi:hypothetical protein
VVDVTSVEWPIAQLGPIERMFVLAKALPGSAYAVRRTDLPVETVWTYIEDLERAIPSLDTAVGTFEIIDRVDDQITARVTASALSRAGFVFDVRLEPGWCLMTSRGGFYAVGFAADSVGESTRVAHLEAVCIPAPRWARRAVAAVLRTLSYLLRHHVASDLRGLMRGLVDTPPSTEAGGTGHGS